jgi:hypothetical protein
MTTKKRFKEKFDGFSKSDEHGNMLKLYFYPKTNMSRVTLMLKAEKRERELGVIDHKTKRLECRRDATKHLFLKFNAYGLNYSLVNDPMVDKVFLYDEKRRWILPKNVIIEKGKFLNFKNNGGFELQIFVPLDEINDYRV